MPDRQNIVKAIAAASRDGRIETQLSPPAPPANTATDAASRGSKVAFLFLIYESIHHEDLWRAFLHAAPSNSYSVHVHAKSRDAPLRHFEACHLPREKVVPTEYADISLVHAMNALLEHALEDEANAKFVFVSGHCIPVKPFAHVYDTLLSDECSLFSEMDTMRGNDQGLWRTLVEAGVDKCDAAKAAQWCVLNRRLARLCVDAPGYYVHCFAKLRAPEEWFYLTMARKHGDRDAHVTRDDASGNHRGPTFANWFEMEPTPGGHRPRTYTSVNIDTAYSLVHGPTLFARKFASDCAGLEQIRSVVAPAPDSGPEAVGMSDAAEQAEQIRSVVAPAPATGPEAVDVADRAEQASEARLRDTDPLRDALLRASVPAEAVDALVAKRAAILDAAAHEQNLQPLLREAGVAKVGLRHKVVSVLQAFAAAPRTSDVPPPPAAAAKATTTTTTRPSSALLAMAARTDNSFNEFGRVHVMPQMDSPKWVPFIDKVEFKEFCRRLGVPTIATLHVLGAPGEIARVYDALPDAFVVKSTKGSGRNLLVGPGAKAEWPPARIADEMRDFGAKWATSGPCLWEKQYDHIEPRLLVEAMVHPVPDDFKVVVSRGRCTVAWIDTRRHAAHASSHRRNVYRILPTYALQPLLDCWWEFPPDTAERALRDLPAPKVAEMCELALRMASGVGLELVRVDLFLIDGVFHGSEVTLTSGSFMEHITERYALEALGQGDHG